MPTWATLIPTNPTVIEQQFDSLYQSFNPLTTVNKQHFVEWFSGNALDSIWTVTHVGSGSSAMEDAVDGGFKLTTGTTTDNHSRIDANDIRHYSHTASVFIGVCKAISTTDNETAIGGNTHVGAPLNDFAMVGVFTGTSTTDFVILTGDGTVSGTAATFSLDTNFHVHQLEHTSSSNIYSIDGVLEVTKTTNRPTSKLQPIFWQKTRTSAAKTGHIRYLEAYNL